MKQDGIDFLILIVCFIIGILGGSAVSRHINREVNSEVREILSNVEMLDVPPIDNYVSDYLAETAGNYQYKYITAIDISDLKYGIYEIKNDRVVAYAHGLCETTGDVQPGVYKIESTKSHIDVNNIRYWRVVELTEGVLVTSPGYKLANIPMDKIDDKGFGNVIISSDIMLTVYDNSEPGIVLIVIDSKGETHD